MVLLSAMLTISQTADARQRVKVRKPKVTAAKDMVRKSELKSFTPIIFGVDSVVMDSPLRTMREMGMKSGTIIYVCTLPEVKVTSVLTLSECHDYAQVFIDEDYIGQIDGTHDKNTLDLPPLHDGQELKILVEAMERSKNTDDFVGLAGPATLTADIDGNELTLSMRRWTILTVPDGYDTVSKALTAVSSDSIALPDTSRKAGYYHFQVVFLRNSNIYLNMENFGKGQVYVNGVLIGQFSNTGSKKSLQVLRKYLKRGLNEVVVLDVAGPRQAVLSAQDRPAVGQ